MGDLVRLRVATSIIYVDIDNTNHSVPVDTVNRVTIKTQFNYIPIHGINEWNQGIMETPPRFSFVIAVPVTSNASITLKRLNASGLPFTITLSEAGSGDVNYVNEELQSCRLNDREMTIKIGELPMDVYTGIALRYKVGDELFGSGVVEQV